MDGEREMTREELIQLARNYTEKCETLQIENNKLKKELEDIKVAFKMEHDDNILRRDSLDRLCDKYRELEKKHEDLQKRQNACADVWVKCEERNDELKKTLEAKNEQIKELQAANWRQSGDIFELRNQRKRLGKDIKEKDEEITALRKKNLDLKNDNEGWKLKYDHLADVRDARIRELNTMTNDYYGVLNAYTNLNKDYHDLKNENERLKRIKENKDLRTKLACSEENVDRAKSVSDDILRRDFEINQLKIQNRMLENSNKRLLEKNLDLKNEKEKLEKELETAKERDTDIHIEKLYPQYFTPLTQPINIENLNVTYYANGPIWTNDDDSDEEEKEDE